jgi:hypothetical protein
LVLRDTGLFSLLGKISNICIIWRKEIQVKVIELGTFSPLLFKSHWSVSWTLRWSNKLNDCHDPLRFMQGFCWSLCSHLKSFHFQDDIRTSSSSSLDHMEEK